MSALGIEKVRKRMPAATMTDTSILFPAIADSFRKLNPRQMAKNPVMFVVEIVATLTTILFIRDLVTGTGNHLCSFQINLWLWFTVLFANFAEAVAEGRGKAQADSLRRTKTDLEAKLLASQATKIWRKVPAASSSAATWCLSKPAS
jgi:K+-transporting ATPase ATPase B chain